MTLEEAKQELVRRYRYLYENAYFILAPFMYEETEEEYKQKAKEEQEKYGMSLRTAPLIYLNIGIVKKMISIC